MTTYSQEIMEQGVEGLQSTPQRHYTTPLHIQTFFEPPLPPSKMAYQPTSSLTHENKYYSMHKKWGVLKPSILPPPHLCHPLKPNTTEVPHHSSALDKDVK